MPGPWTPLRRIWRCDINMPLLYQAALRGVFGEREQYIRSSITDALFVYLDGEPEPESIARVDSNFRNRPPVWNGLLTGNPAKEIRYPLTISMISNVTSAGRINKER